MKGLYTTAGFGRSFHTATTTGGRSIFTTGRADKEAGDLRRGTRRAQFLIEARRETGISVFRPTPHPTQTITTSPTTMSTLGLIRSEPAIRSTTHGCLR